MASAEGFVRRPLEPEVIGDAELVRRCGELLDGSPAERWHLGRELAAAVRRASDRRLGPAYTSWRDGDTIYLSCLPSVGFYGLDQGTYEFVTSSDRSSLRLQAVWQSSDPIWTRVSYEEFHARVNGLIADRSGCDLDREAVILICGTRADVSASRWDRPQTGPSRCASGSALLRCVEPTSAGIGIPSWSTPGSATPGSCSTQGPDRSCSTASCRGGGGPRPSRISATRSSSCFPAGSACSS
jgi:hypothetical protein